jgi:hypothetical protein
MSRSSSFLDIPGYTFEFRRHALAILQQDYREACKDLRNVLKGFYIKEKEALAGGGGESTITQRLRRGLDKLGWKKRKVQLEEIIDGITFASDTHEIDHMKSFGRGAPGVAIEIEWNNKDPFYDRDLGNFRRLQEIGLISVGIIITRGESLQQELLSVFKGHFLRNPGRVKDELMKKSLRDRIKGKKFTSSVEKAEAVARAAFDSKYGQATTHMNKLMDRINRNVGSPCPLLLIGIEKERLKRSTEWPFS